MEAVTTLLFQDSISSFRRTQQGILLSKQMYTRPLIQQILTMIPTPSDTPQTAFAVLTERVLINMRETPALPGISLFLTTSQNQQPSPSALIPQALRSKK